MLLTVAASPICLGAVSAGFRMHLIERNRQGEPIYTERKIEIVVRHAAGGRYGLVLELSEEIGGSCNKQGCNSTARGMRFPVVALHTDPCGGIEYRGLLTMTESQLARIEVSDNSGWRQGPTCQARPEPPFRVVLHWPGRPPRWFIGEVISEVD